MPCQSTRKHRLDLAFACLMPDIAGTFAGHTSLPRFSVPVCLEGLPVLP
jgi:hypothetical protein